MIDPLVGDINSTHIGAGTRAGGQKLRLHLFDPEELDGDERLDQGGPGIRRRYGR